LERRRGFTIFIAPKVKTKNILPGKKKGEGIKLKVL
jgi:hypothetical protein